MTDKDVPQYVDTNATVEELKYQREHGIPKGLSTGWHGFDQSFMVPPFGQLNVVTGNPGPANQNGWTPSQSIWYDFINGKYSYTVQRTIRLSSTCRNLQRSTEVNLLPATGMDGKL